MKKRSRPQEVPKRERSRGGKKPAEKLTAARVEEIRDGLGAEAKAAWVVTGKKVLTGLQLTPDMMEPEVYSDFEMGLNLVVVGLEESTFTKAAAAAKVYDKVCKDLGREDEEEAVNPVLGKILIACGRRVRTHPDGAPKSFGQWLGFVRRACDSRAGYKRVINSEHLILRRLQRGYAKLSKFEKRELSIIRLHHVMAVNTLWENKLGGG